MIKLLNKILRFYILVLLVFIPLYPKIPLLNVSGTFVAVRLEDILIAILVIIWILYLILDKRFHDLAQDKIIKILAVFFFIGILSLFSGFFITHTITLNLGFLHYLRRVEFMILTPIVYTVIKTRKEVIVSLVTLSLVTFLVGIYALGQQYLHWPVISTTNSEFSKGLILYLTPGARVNSTFAGHYDLAVFTVLVLSLSSALWFYVKYHLKIWILIISALSFYILVLTAARLSFLAAGMGIFLSLLITGNKKIMVLLFILLLVAIVYPSQLRDRLISTVTINILHQGERYVAPNYEKQKNQLNIPTLAREKTKEEIDATKSASPSALPSPDIVPGEPVDSTELGIYRSFTIRVNYEWPQAIRALIKNPLLGTGYSSLGLATDNDFLRSLGETGVLGTWVFILLFWEIIKRAKNNLKAISRFLRFFSAGILSLIVAILINGLFIDVFEASKIAALFWMIVGLYLSAHD